MSEPVQFHSVLVGIQYIEAAAQLFGVQRFSDLDPSMYDMVRTVALALMALDTPPRPIT
jgi:hypothetical protein